MNKHLAHRQANYKMKYCSQCGSAVVHKVPKDDNRPRYVCVSCNEIHYQNPNIVAGTLPVYGSQVLLCRRAIEPCYGFWTLPAGFMENLETTDEAALRETWEEAQAKVRLDGLFTVINVPQISQVHMYYRATLTKKQFAAGSESLEVALFDEENIPWDELAFPTVKRSLQLFFQDRKNGCFGVHVSDIIKEPRELPKF